MMVGGSDNGTMGEDDNRNIIILEISSSKRDEIYLFNT